MKYIVGAGYLTAVAVILFGFAMGRAFIGEATALDLVFMVGSALALAGAYLCWERFFGLFVEWRKAREQA